MLYFLLGVGLIGFLIYQICELIEIRQSVEAGISDAIRDYRPGRKPLSDMDRLVEKIAQTQAEGKPVNIRMDGAEQGGNKLLCTWLGAFLPVRAPVLPPEFVQRVLDKKEPAPNLWEVWDEGAARWNQKPQHRASPPPIPPRRPPLGDRARGITRRDDSPVPDTDRPRFTDSFWPVERHASNTSAKQSIATPTRGLVITSEPLDKILSGMKVMELRSRHTRQLGPVALIRKGSKHIYGVATVTSSDGPMSMEKLAEAALLHGVRQERLQEVFDKNWRIGWMLSDIWRLEQPVPYRHAGMSQVKLDDDDVMALRHALQRAVPVKLAPTYEDFLTEDTMSAWRARRSKVQR